MKQVSAPDNGKGLHNCPVHGSWGHDVCRLQFVETANCPLCNILMEDYDGAWWFEETFENWVAEVRNNRVRD